MKLNAAISAAGLLWVALGAPVFGKDVLLYKVSKGFHHQQTLTAPPAILAENGYVFEAEVLLPLPGTVTSAIVESTEGTDRALALDGGDQFEFRNRVNSRNTLDTRYPDGPFTFTINGVIDGRKVISLPLTGNTYPNAPRIANLPQLQSVNANGYAIVQWDSFGGGTAQDFIHVRIEDAGGDRVFETQDFGESGALDGAATYAIIHPDTLKPNATYQATLRFDKTSARDTTTYTGVPGWSTHHTLTRFTIVTSAAGAPEVESYSVTKGRRFDQTSLDSPQPDRNDEFYFTADVEASSPDAVTSVLLSRPAGEAIRLLTDGSESSYSDWKQTREFLDAEYVDGTYSFSIATASEGNRVVPLRLAGNAYPPVPHLSNFNPGEAVRADRGLVLEWHAWAGGTASDFIQLRIEDDDDDLVFETPDFGETEALKGGATWALVPAGTFRPGKAYQGRLAFTRFVTLDTTSYPGALGMASYYSRTKFDIVAGPPDVTGFVVVKGGEHRQTAPDTVVPKGHYSFSARVIANAPGSVESASLTLPGGWTLPLAPEADGWAFSLSETHSTQGQLDAAYPNGTYRLTIRGVNDGARTVPLELTNVAYPKPPLISEFEATGQIFPFFDFTISWSAFEGGRNSDFILLEALDRGGGLVYNTGDYRQPGSMGGLTTAALLPGDLFMPNNLYFGRVRFEKVARVEHANYPEVEGRTGIFTTTEWTMATYGEGNPTTFIGCSKAADGSLEMIFPTVVGATYMIEGSGDLAHWTPLATIPAAGEQTAYRAAIQPGAPHYFYRAVFRR